MFLSLILTNEGHEAFIVGGLAELLHQGLGLLLGQLLSEVGQQSEQLVGQHGVVVVLVVQLQDLNEVVEASLVLGVLAGLVHGEHVGLGQHLLSLLGGASDLSDGLQGGVEVAGTDEVTGVEGVHLAISLEVVDIEGEVDGLDLLLLEPEFRHGACVCCVAECCTAGQCDPASVYILRHLSSPRLRSGQLSLPLILCIAL